MRGVQRRLVRDVQHQHLDHKLVRNLCNEVERLDVPMMMVGLNGSLIESEPLGLKIMLTPPSLTLIL